MLSSFSLLAHADPPAPCHVLLHLIAPLGKRPTSLPNFQLTRDSSPESPVAPMSAQHCFPAHPLQFIKSWLSLLLKQLFAVGVLAACGRRGENELFFHIPSKGTVHAMLKLNCF